jgi:hypothetical protein
MVGRTKPERSILPVIAESVVCLALAACGGGGGGGGGGGDGAANPGAGAPSGGSSGSLIELGNLPTSRTQSTSAAITYEVSAGSVYCRLDSYLPIACPNPFVVGATPAQALSAGTHTVDYYVDTGSGIDPSNPTSSYTWTVELAAAAPSTGAPSGGAVSGALPAAFAVGSKYSLEAPSDSDGGSYAAKSYSNAVSLVSSLLGGLPSVSRGGVMRLGPATVDGKPVLRHEVRSGDPLRNGGNRAELSYDSMQIQHGVDYWMSFAIKLDADWTAANSGGSGDQQSFMQVHQQNSETTLTNGGPFGIKWRGNAGKEIEVFSLGPSNSPVTRFTTAATPNTWMRFIVHYRSGVTSAQSPTLEVWQAVGTGAAYTKLTDQAPGSPFGDPAQNSTRDWAKIGIYKWTSGTYGSTSKRGMYSSGLFFGQGTNLYDQAAAAVSGF